jgi:hypothetical protein
MVQSIRLQEHHMKMHIDISESYMSGICTVWQTDHGLLGRRFIVYDPDSILSPVQYSAFLRAATLS